MDQEQKVEELEDQLFMVQRIAKKLSNRLSDAADLVARGVLSQERFQERRDVVAQIFIEMRKAENIDQLVALVQKVEDL